MLFHLFLLLVNKDLYQLFLLLLAKFVQIINNILDSLWVEKILILVVRLLWELRWWWLTSLLLNLLLIVVSIDHLLLLNLLILLILSLDLLLLMVWVLNHRINILILRDLSHSILWSHCSVQVMSTWAASLILDRNWLVLLLISISFT